MLQALALSYQSGTHFGYLISGKFERGGNRGEGRWMSSQERDRVRALQLMSGAMKLVQGNQAVRAEEAFPLYLSFAGMILAESQNGSAWKLTPSD